MRFAYGNEKLSLAVYSLATSEKPLRDRLAGAYVLHVSYVRPGDVSKEAWEQIEFIGERLNREIPDPEREGFNFSNARSLEEGEVREMIEAIVSSALQTEIAFKTQQDSD